MGNKEADFFMDVRKIFFFKEEAGEHLTDETDNLKII